MAENLALQVVISAVDKTKDAFSSVSSGLEGAKSKLESLEPTFKKMATAGTVAFGAISALAIKSINDYAGAEAAQKQLEHAVIDVSHATREQLDATAALADELQRKGVLDGDAIKMGLAQLSTFGLTNKQVQGLAGSLADLAVNQFGVNAGGQELTQTANMIAKALNGQFGVLEKSGIRFTEAQQKAIQFGSEMERVNAINEGFAQNLKYTNDVALSTLEGQMAKAKSRVGDLSESLGKALMPIMLKLIETISPLLEKFIAWAEQNPDLVKKIVIVAGAIAGIVAILGTLGLIIPPIIAGAQALGVAFTVMTGPVGIVIAVIAALIAAGVYLYKHWDEIKAKAIEIWTNIKNAISAKVDEIKISILTFLANVGAKVYETWDNIKTAFANALDSILTLFSTWWAAYWGFWQSAWNMLVGVFSTVWDGIKAVLEGIWTGIKLAVALAVGIIIEIFNAFGIDILAVLETIKNIFIGAWTAIKDFIVNTAMAIYQSFMLWWETLMIYINTALTILVATWNTMWTAIKDFFIAIMTRISDFFMQIWNALSAYIHRVLELIKNVWITVWTAVSEVFMKIWEEIKGAIDAGWKFIVDLFNRASEPVKNAWNNLWDGVKNGLTAAWESIKSTILSGINWVIDKINSAINAINSVAQKGASALGLSVPSIGTIPHLAQGGIVTKPTTALIGEAGDEAVIPLSKLKDMVGGGPSINITITGNSFMGKENVAEEIGDIIIRQLQQNIKYNMI